MYAQYSSWLHGAGRFDMYIVTITPEMALLILYSGYNIIIYLNCICCEGRSGETGSFQGGSQGRLVQVTEYSYTKVQAADSLTFGDTSQIELKQSHAKTQPLELG